MLLIETTMAYVITLDITARDANNIEGNIKTPRDVIAVIAYPTRPLRVHRLLVPSERRATSYFRKIVGIPR